ncbi:MULTISPECIES: hypothetical protein [unclassified Mesorhizobium]|uniref:hypothetical protein n=1 Tax=unclassified Mesorhizobium TaxID=325217 RepID=UPI000FD9473F|nr:MULTISPECIES: hypothetical protein [unclassified Mesorhizobium]TGQ04000.1 hypothetical protein EN862_034075 [Mesorhizobium sp. M2E.F.Ca.ET.219.01.1.1]TGT63089.1 hypothetical protein EN809_036565 [Mesorhizobium sp. M2E.F.Ca.ET.166.01.1.1]TGV96759.1 hypothetical protein EN797_036270 [Mesorhizobium sp. M2E.F.Ca.ET.154.01.1.1]
MDTIAANGIVARRRAGASHTLSKRSSGWVSGPDDQQILAFTDFGLECLINLIREHKANRRSDQSNGR